MVIEQEVTFATVQYTPVNFAHTGIDDSPLSETICYEYAN